MYQTLPMMNSQKINNVIGLSQEERYGYFIRKAADFEEVWGLFDDGWASLMDNSEHSVLPVWPEKEFAALCATGTWSNFTPKSIALADFLDKWLPGMEEDGTKVNVFLVPDEKNSLLLEPGMVLKDLNDELQTLE